MAADGLFAAESPQLLWPTGTDGVNILVAAKVWYMKQRKNKSITSNPSTKWGKKGAFYKL